MKKIFGLIAILIFTMGCDDGDMTFKTFNFGTAKPEPCDNSTGTNTLYFKIQGTEVLILDLDPSALKNEATYDPVTQVDKPRDVFIDGTKNKIRYINYKSAVTKSMLCDGVLSTLPDIVDEWSGIGNLSIRTDAKKSSKGFLTGYSHQITLKNISFKNGEETITINNNLFGSVLSTLDFEFNFIRTAEVAPIVLPCPANNNLIYTSNNNEALILSLPAGTFPNSVGTKTISLTETGNQAIIIFRVFGNTVISDYICNSLVTPVVKQNWLANTGKIVINTKAGIGGSFTHDIYLKDVVLTNAKGENLKISDVATISDQGYFFGTY